MTYRVSIVESHAFVKREYGTMHVGSSVFVLIKPSEILDAHVPIAIDCAVVTSSSSYNKFLHLASTSYHTRKEIFCASKIV